jgi:predicted peptidase
MMTLTCNAKWCVVVVSFCVLAFAAVRARADDDYEALVFKTDDGQTLSYRLLKPKDYDAKKKYPLVVFLHGAGERGSDNKAQLIHFVPIFVSPENREKYPCFVLVPQCPSGEKWSDVNWGASTHGQPEKASKSMALTIQLIGQLEKQYSIDAKRRYIGGLSMGGYGTWDAIVRYPEMFAAAVPICGGGDETKADAIAKLPIWVFHGAKDGAVKPERSRNMVAALKKAGGSPKYTEYPNEGHGSWVPASKEPELLPWLFAQKRE